MNSEAESIITCHIFWYILHSCATLFLVLLSMTWQKEWCEHKVEKFLRGTVANSPQVLYQTVREFCFCAQFVRLGFYLAKDSELAWVSLLREFRLRLEWFWNNTVSSPSNDVLRMIECHTPGVPIRSQECIMQIIIEWKLAFKIVLHSYQFNNPNISEDHWFIFYASWTHSTYVRT